MFVLFAVLFLNAMVVHSTDQIYSTPLFMWSTSKKIFANSYANKDKFGVYSNIHMDEESVVKSFQNVLTLNMNEDKWNILNRREIAYLHAEKFLCVILADSLRTDQLSELASGAESSKLEQVLSKATSVSIRPHAFIEKKLTETLKKQNENKDTIMLTQDQLAAFIADDKNFAHDKTKLLVIQLKPKLSFPEIDSAVEKIVEQMNKATNSNCAFSFTSNQAAKPSANHAARVLTEEATTKVSVNGSDDTPLTCRHGEFKATRKGKAPFCYTHKVYITPQIIFGLGFGFFFIVATFIGIQCLGGIQTPSKYSLQAPPKGKEY